MISSSLHKHGVLSTINEHVRFARKRFGRSDVIDVLVVLSGYAVSSKRTREKFSQRLQSLAIPFIALVGRDQLPSRSALSRFSAAMTETPVAVRRDMLPGDLLSRPLTSDQQTGSLLDRTGYSWTVFDIDGTREAARQRAFSQTEDPPPPFRLHATASVPKPTVAGLAPFCWPHPDGCRQQTRARGPGGQPQAAGMFATSLWDALPRTPLPVVPLKKWNWKKRRDDVCAPGSRVRMRGEVVSLVEDVVSSGWHALGEPAKPHVTTVQDTCAQHRC